MPTAKTALLVVDMINSYDFEDAEKLLASAREAVPNIRTAIERAREADVPIVYVNDNFGRWNSSPSELVEEVLGTEHRVEIERIVLTGQVTEQCILYSALDAYIRHLSVVVPTDAVAHIHEDLAAAALRMMEVNMRAELCRAGDCRF